MAISEKLKEEGCYLSPEGIEAVGIDEDAADVKVILQKVLDFDLREIGAPAFPEEFLKSGAKCETLEEPILVQIQKVRNISAPKVNEESKHAPRMLKFILTDGHLTCQAIEIEHISGLSINTPPGTKLQLKSGQLNTAHGFLFIGPSSIKILGGHVTHMVDKWELNRSLAKHTRGGGGGEGSPPPWIPFGQPLDGRDQEEMAFKSLQDAVKIDNAEFEAQRKGAIAEAQKLSGIKKIFGGGTKPMLDANVQKIVDAGFSEEQAENALKISRNNADRALKNLQRREGTAEVKKDRPAKQPSEAPKGRKGRSKEGGEEDGINAVKPSGKVSLFDFLEDKLPTVAEPEKPVKPEPVHFNKDDNKYERSNNDRRGGHNARGAVRGGHRGAASRPQTSYGSGPPNRSDHNNQSQNSSYSHNEHQQRNYNNYQREDRPQHNYNSQQIPNEKAPRFQKKFDGEAKRQQNITTSHESAYPPNYQQQQQQQQMQSNYYSDRRNAPDNRNQRGFYGQQANQMESIVDATAAMSIDSNTQSRFGNRPNMMQQQNYQNNYNNYSPKPNYNNQNSYPDPNYKRNNQYPNNNKTQMANGQAVNPSFYNMYSNEGQMKHNQNQGAQPDMMEVYRQTDNQQNDPQMHREREQRNNFNNKGNGFYQAANIVGFQNASINEQARKMLAEGSEVNWNIGDRCMAKYWEDNGYYDAEITGISNRTVVVRFLAYGNHEEVLRTDCYPPNWSRNNQGRPLGRDGPPMGRSENGSRGGRFHQPMYVPPAQRKA